MPEWLTRKMGPLPTWGWAAVVVGGVLVWRWYQARQAASAATSATPTSANVTATVPSDYTEPTASLTTPSGFSYSGPLSGLGASLPYGALSQTSGGNAPPQVGALTGLGYAPPSGQNYATSNSGQTYVPFASWGSALAEPANTPVYYEPAQGVFQQAGTVGAGASNLTLPGGTGTPLYLPSQ